MKPRPVNTTACKGLFSLGCVAHTDGAVFQLAAKAKKIEDARSSTAGEKRAAQAEVAKRPSSPAKPQPASGLHAKVAQKLQARPDPRAWLKFEAFGRTV